MGVVVSRVVLIADSRFPISEPFAGGMQSLTWNLARGLRRHGVNVTVFAGPGTDPRLQAQPLTVRPLRLSPAARQDVAMAPDEWMDQHHAYLQLMLRLARAAHGDDYDVVHNNSLHHLPVAMADALPIPVITTLHTPPTPWIEPAVALCDPRHQHFVAVSRHTSRAWSDTIWPAPQVIHNGVDVHRWVPGPGGSDLVWVGRIAPEKAPHLAIEVARRSGRRLRLAGPVSDPAYFRDHVAPALGPTVEYVGHLRQRELAVLIGSSALCLVTPTWDEPYGLVAAEALACGTPVLGFARGGLPEVVSESCARLSDGGTDGLVELVAEAERLDRGAARQHAVRNCSLERMLQSYLGLYDDLAEARAA